MLAGSGSGPTRCAPLATQGGRAVHMGGTAGIRTGEGPSLGDVPSHSVTIYNHHVDQVITVDVPEDR